MLFWYLAYSRELTTIVSGVCAASSKSEACAVIDEYADVLIVFRAWFTHRVLRDLRDALVDISVVVGAGVRLADAFGLVAKSSTLVSGILQSISLALSRGEEIKDVFAKRIAPLDGVVAGMLSGAHSTEHWHKSLGYAIKYLDYRISASGAVRKGLIYPLFVMTVIACVVLFYSLYVLPEFGRSSCVMPLVTVLLWGLFVALFVFADKVCLGDDYIHACYFYSMHSLLSVGVSMQNALSTVAVAFNSDSLKRMESSVLQGFEFSHALAGFPEVVRTMIRNAERRGGIDQACKNVADMYLVKVSAKLAWFTSLLNPVLICIVGCVLAVIVANNMSMLNGVVGGY